MILSVAELPNQVQNLPLESSDGMNARPPLERKNTIMLSPANANGQVEDEVFCTVETISKDVPVKFRSKSLANFDCATTILSLNDDDPPFMAKNDKRRKSMWVGTSKGVGGKKVALKAKRATSHLTLKTKFLNHHFYYCLLKKKGNKFDFIYWIFSYLSTFSLSLRKRSFQSVHWILILKAYKLINKEEETTKPLC